MHKTLFAGTILYCAAAFSANYYVDANYGDDNWTGTAPIEELSGTTGPKKTLKGAMEISGLKSGDVVYAAAGMYTNEVMTTTETIGSASVTVKSRVVVPAGVTLKATDGALRSFIVGEEDKTDSKWNGCGPDSVRCAFLGKGAKLIGFTVTGGRAAMTSATAGAAGGGICCDKPAHATLSEYGTIDHCIISNNYAYALGGGGCFGIYKYCRIVGNSVSSTKAGTFSGVGYEIRLVLRDCYIDGNTGGQSQAHAMREMSGTTFGPNGAPSFATRGDWSVTGYNCAILRAPARWTGDDSHPEVKFTPNNCYVDEAIPNLPADFDEQHRRPASDFKLDAVGRPKRGSCLIDAGVNAYCSDMTGADIFGVPRILNATIDVGAYEHDSRSDFSTALDPLGGVTVTHCSRDVKLGDDAKTVQLAPGTSLDVSWSYPSGLEDLWLNARVTGTGSLKIYNTTDDPQLLWTIVRGDGDRKLEAVAGGSPRFFRFEYEEGESDDGGAEIFDFSVMAGANIVATDGGLSLTGVQHGVNQLPSAGPLSFTVQRVFDSATSVCTGVLSNGVYYAFDDYPNGLLFSVSYALRNNVIVEAVYNTEPTEWYVDAENGDDNANYGRHPKNAFKTLAKVMSFATTAGDVVWALPGVYSNGTMTTSEGHANTVTGTNEYHDVLNRVVVPTGVTLRSVEGAEKTVILGERDPVQSNWSGCGTNSVRCAYLKPSAKLIGFTLTGGHARCDYKTSNTTYAWYADGGGVQTESSSTSIVTDSIITNNFARDGGACKYGSYARCRITDNNAGGQYVVSGPDNLKVYDCYIGGNTGGSELYAARIVMNTTFGRENRSFWNGVNASFMMQMYNCVVLGTPQTWNKVAFHRCAFSSGITDVTNKVAATGDADCMILPTSEINLSAAGVPLPGSKLIDAGSNNYYTASVPSSLSPGRDANGTPRMLGGRIDLGAYEYDWRADFAEDIGGRIVVDDASQNVVETEDSTVLLGDGDSLTLGWRAGAKVSEREFLFNVDTGTLTITRNGETAATMTSGGSWRYTSPDPSDVLVFSFAGEGSAEVLKSHGDGFLLLFK